MRIAYVAAGAAGMYCGSCIHDNTVAAALMRQGHEVALIPTYTPLRTDEQDVSVGRVFYGAINVYLQQKLGLFRHTPRFLDRLLDRPSLLSWVSRFSASTSARELSELTLSVLEGENGHQAKELTKLAEWLGAEYRPDVVHITNSMFLGMVRRIRQAVKVPVLVSVQGEDLFLDDLGEPYRAKAVAALARRAADADLFLAPSHYYAAAMGELLGVPPERMRVVPLGIRLDGHRDGDLGLERRDGTTIGYLARICPEKGFHLLVEAFLRLAREPGRERLQLRAAGYLGEKDRPFLERLVARVGEAGLGDRFEYQGEVDLGGKIRFLRALDVASVPTVYREAKGLPVLEALANAVPMVQPRHGSFPELLEATGGGILVEPQSVEALAAGLAALLDDRQRRLELGRRGREAVLAGFNDEVMAQRTLAVYEEMIGAARTAGTGPAATAAVGVRAKVL